MIEEQEPIESKGPRLENGLSLVIQNSEEWKMAEFHLKSSIPSEIKIDKMISVKNTLTYNQFEYLAKNHLWTYGWYCLKGDDYDIEMQKMREKSFKIPKIGANFRVGAIFDGINNSDVQSVFVLCKIIIGKSFCKIKQEGEKESPPEVLDHPYESYMYCSPESSAKSQKMSWSMTKPYSYYIKNIQYIEPLYCVYFSHIDSYITNLESKYMCSECKTKEAEWYCPDCVNYYCKNCQTSVHYGNVTDTRIKEIFKHGNIVPVQYTTRPGKCAIHRKKDSEYYCDICKKAICGYCRWKGPHAKGLQSRHTPEDLYSEWKKADSHIQEYDEKKKNGISIARKINEQIRTIQEKMIINQMDITKKYDDHKTEVRKKAAEGKLKVFQYIACLREIKRNLLYYHNYFVEREQYLQEQGNEPELAFIWSIHQEKIYDLLVNYEEIKRRRDEMIKITNDCIIRTPDFNPVISIAEFDNFFKKKEQTEMTNKDSNAKFESDEKFKNTNIDVITRNKLLFKELKEKRKAYLQEKQTEKTKEDYSSKLSKSKGKHSDIEEEDEDDELDRKTMNTDMI